MFEIIELKKTLEWNAIVRSMAGGYDFYSLAEYHSLDESGEALLFHYVEDQTVICLPIILRAIEGTDLKDVTSVYGYAGALSNKVQVEPEVIARFQEQVRAAFDDLKVVSAFSRLHPLLPHYDSILTGMGAVRELNKTVAIDLRFPEDEQRRQYARSLKYQINHLRREGVSVRRATTEADVEAFIRMYEETMDRVGASAKYYFPRQYFFRFLNELDAILLLAEYEGKLIAGSLLTVCDKIMQAHLNATRNDSLHLSPLKMILEEARLIAVERDLDYLHLGGGFGGQNDSLFTFKSRFSHQFYPFKTWEYIHNPEEYARLTELNKQRKGESTSFFPSYRS